MRVCLSRVYLSVCLCVALVTVSLTLILASQHRAVVYLQLLHVRFGRFTLSSWHRELCEAVFAFQSTVRAQSPAVT